MLNNYLTMPAPNFLTCCEMLFVDLKLNILKVKRNIIQKNSVIVYQITDLDFLKNSKIAYRVILEENAQCQFLIMLCKIQEATIELEIIAQGNQASFEIIFLYALSFDQKVTIITRQIHSVQRTDGKLYARGIIMDSAIVNHQGLIAISEQGEKTVSLLEHKTLVFSQQAQVILIPSIEVLNNNVQCFHGAAVGKLQQEHVWYLQLRGFDEKMVQQILV